MFVVRSPERPDRRGARRGRDRVRLVLRDAAPPPARDGVPRLRARLAARDRACGRREPRAADVGRDRAFGAGAGRLTVRAAVGWPSRRHVRSPVTRHSIWQVGVDARSSPAPGGSRGTSASRPGPSTTTATSTGRSSSSSSRSSCRSSPSRLLQPLVALRLDARHVGGAPRRRARVDRGLPRLHALRRPPRRRPARRLVHRPPALPRARRRLAAAGADADRAPAARPDRHPRQGRRRRRRGGRARREGDAAQPALGYTPIGLLDDDPRKRNLRLHGVRVLGTDRPRARRPRPAARRDPDRDPLGIGRAPRAHRRDRAALQVTVKTLPSLSDLVSGDATSRQLRPVEVEDVLGREPVEVDLASISDYLADEVVRHGAGGSIGRSSAARSRASARRSSCCSTTPSRRCSRSSASSSATGASPQRPSSAT